ARGHGDHRGVQVAGAQLQVPGAAARPAAHPGPLRPPAAADPRLVDAGQRRRAVCVRSCPELDAPVRQPSRQGSSDLGRCPCEAEIALAGTPTRPLSATLARTCASGGSGGQPGLASSAACTPGGMNGPISLVTMTIWTI